ncbi:uncharacterized protein LOC133893529 [Phragmites australis]|uniref:uncharacterized protein LOC133893529 n=1 Tax=Phragmites australis TaxID=29695 RepID=UPI002D76B9C2|nr:uncharacterized protein LOC133893529 [Phragmites australis]
MHQLLPSPLRSTSLCPAMGMGYYAPSNRQLVESLYGSLSRGVTAALLAEDVDWWFHGPRRCQHMRRLLTGEAGPSAFRFAPARVTEVGSGEGEGGWVVAEGWEGEHAYWVLQGGVITRFREYFNTSVTVRELGRLANSTGMGWAVWQSQAMPLHAWPRARHLSTASIHYSIASRE